MVDDPRWNEMTIEELKTQAIGQRLALKKCMLLSLQEIRRATVRADARAEEQWRHILRFCESAGIKPSVLRSSRLTADV